MDDDAINSFIKEYYTIRETYSDSDIYNVDETGLFIKSPNNRSYVQRENKTYRKELTQIKTRITVMLGVNIT